MEKTMLKKKSLNELENYGRIKKAEMKSYFGTGKKHLGKKNPKIFFDLYTPDPCEGKLPQ